MVPFSMKRSAKPSASLYAQAAITFWVSAAMAALSASEASVAGGVVAVMRLVLSLASPGGSDVLGVGLQATQHAPVQFGVGVRVHKRMQGDRLDIARDPLDRHVGVDRGPPT